MNNLKISTRLVMLLAVMGALLCSIGGIGLYATNQANQGMRSIYEDRTVPLKQLADINYLINRNRILVMDMRSVVDEGGEKSVLESRHSELVANTQKTLDLWKSYMATELTQEEGVIASKFESSVKAYYTDALTPASTALLAGDAGLGTSIYKTKISPLAPGVQQLANELMDLQSKVAQTEYNNGLARYERIRNLSIGAILIGLVLAGVFGFSLIKNISSALLEASALSNAVADGDLRSKLQVRGKNEVADVLRNLTQMQGNISEIVTRVRDGSEAVATASAQIASGNNDLSARTEQQASALEETAASMEELASTVKQNAENARQGNQLAQSASSVAIHGGEVVAEVVVTMKGINDSSKKIAEIISVIDGIAFQTNILALNAAVEAARAGEQGRGFAVVASEVRSLAGRSADAAKEINKLISDSVVRVDHGTQLVDKAGTTMQDIVSSIRRVTDIMGEISAASTEQSQGVDQIGEAVQQMDQVTQQNAALVEEMAAAASSLQHQARDLVNTVSVFKLG
jgi:methyl-accepting chemotaxis protein